MRRTSSRPITASALLVAPLIALSLVGGAVTPAAASGTVAAAVVTAAPIPTTSKPTITGTARVGSTLTAQPGVWSSGTTFTYQWSAGGVAIAGVTTKSLVLKKAQLASVITVTVTGAATGYTSTSRVSDPTAAVVAGVPSTPLTVVASKDDAARTATLTWAVPTSDGGSAITGYRVARNGTDASGQGPWSYLAPATARSRVFTNLAPGTTYTLTVAAVNAVGDSVVSSAVVTMARGTLSLGTPTISGTPQVGVTLTSTPGTWAPQPVTYTYQWFRGTTAIPDASSSTYTPVVADVGKVLKVRVTGSKTGYNSANSSSAPSAAVLPTSPSAAQSVAATKDDAAHSATISWLPPASDGGSPITGYRVARDGTDSTGQGAWSHTYPADRRSVTHINLAPGATYNLSVTPTNAVGSGQTTAVQVVMAKGTLTTAAPTITGSRSVGSTLTANPGPWGPAPVTFAYQWKRNGTAIAGATAQTYVLVAADAGQAITVAATGSKTGYTTAVRASIAVTVEKQLTKVGTPTITGTPRPGNELTANPGVWAPSPVTLEYQWKRNGAAIPDATEQTYLVTTADAGKTITVTVTGTKATYTPGVSTSAAFPIEGILTAATPAVTGTLSVGSTLTANPGSWGPAPVTFAYQWKRNGTAIAGATAQTYVLAAADGGQGITVTVTGSKAGYTSASRTSTSKTIQNQFTAIGTPAIAGTALVGETLTANPGEWGPQPVTLTYQWSRDGSAIASATATTYAVTTADIGVTLTVTVTGSKTGYTTASRTSAGVLAEGVLQAGVPSISGEARAGSTLTADPGGWGPAPVSLGYQWLANGSDIPGATGASFTPGDGEVGKQVAVRVTGTKAGYRTVQNTSAATGQVQPRPVAGVFATVMARTQRMADASLSSGQSGWYETGSRLQLLCHKRGQAVKGYYSPYLPNGGWDDLWYKVSDNYFVADVDINTGSNNPVVNACETGGQPGVNGWAYPILPHSTLTTYPNHSGDDFPVGTGTPVYSMGTGPVTFSTYAVTSAWCPVPGAIGRQQTDLRISTNRDGHTYLITYAHMNSYTVSSGQTVQAGQLIGYSGARGCADGPHLHVDMKVDGVANVMYPRNIFGTSY